jgi:integrase
MKRMELPDGRTFGAIPLSRLTWQDIELLYAAMRASGRGPSWTRRCASVLTRALDLARKRDLIDTNPAKDAVRPKTVRTKPFAPAERDVRELLDRVSEQDPELGDLALLLASTGMRVGEALALRWMDFDRAKEELHVAGSITDGGPGVGLLRRTTKRSDWRDVPLTPLGRWSTRTSATVSF